MLGNMKLKNIHLYDYIVIYAKSCDLHITRGDEKVLILKHSIAILEKNIAFDIEIIRNGEGELYECFELSSELLSSLRYVLEPVFKVSTEDYTNRRDFKKKIFKIEPCSVTVEFFKKLKNCEVSNISSTYKLAYIISKCENLSDFATSLYSSVAVSFSEKITTLLFSDLSRRWKLSDIADQMHISEISVRKKLEMESINFNQLLLDVRMNQAAKLIIRSDHQIGIIASLVGYSSTSYFIKTFKDYYGITPKQFNIGIKENHCWYKN
ncbi:TPA: helix-turn-helix domain-containing protein [Klebsiella oxytoca]|nr:helix-turn-helix domain-containing protein [Klebsiella oxytoca]